VYKRQLLAIRDLELRARVVVEGLWACLLYTSRAPFPRRLRPALRPAAGTRHPGRRSRDGADRPSDCTLSLITHLDVYKRQIHKRAPTRWAMPSKKQLPARRNRPYCAHGNTCLLYTSARVDHPDDPQHWRSVIDATATISDTLPGLPPALGDTLVEAPLLPKSCSAVTASGVAGGLLPYPVLFTCTLPDVRKQLTGALLYVKPGSLVLVPQFEPIEGDLLVRTTESLVLLTVPAGTLKPCLLYTSRCV